MSATSSTAPIDRRDIRSASRPFKRDRDHGSKWSNGQRPSAGCYINYSSPTDVEEICGGSESQREKVRPRKQNSQAYTESKSHANRAPKLSGTSGWDLGRASGRVAHRSDAHFDAQDSPLSRSLLELLPQHTNNTNSPIQTALRPSDSDILYSFDNKGPSPSDNGINVVLEGLVEKAEQKWVSEQTDKIVRGEYEVLDVQGETTVLRKGKRSPKQKAAKFQPAAVKGVNAEDDDGFELI